MTGLFLCPSIFDPSLSRENQLLIAAGAILFGGLIVFAAYRVFYHGIGSVEYDADTVIFHCSRREQFRFCWGESVHVGPWQGGYMFTILTGWIYGKCARPVAGRAMYLVDSYTRKSTKRLKNVKGELWAQRLIALCF